MTAEWFPEGFLSGGKSVTVIICRAFNLVFNLPKLQSKGISVCQSLCFKVYWFVFGKADLHRWERNIQRERSKPSICWLTPSNNCRSWSWASPFLHVSFLDAGAQRLEPSSALFPRHKQGITPGVKQLGHKLMPFGGTAGRGWTYDSIISTLQSHNTTFVFVVFILNYCYRH